MLSAVGLDLVENALHDCFYFKRSLKAFLRRNYIKESVLSRLDDETTKREFIDWLLPLLERSDRGQRLLREIATDLASMKVFTDAQSSRTPDDFEQVARQSVENLRDFMRAEKQAETDEAERVRIRSAAEARRQSNLNFDAKLGQLQGQLNDLAERIGTSKAGYEFEDWFYELAQLFEIDARPPYTSQGRQQDGSITVDGMSFLISLKFEKEQCGVDEISNHRDKIDGKADFTMGIIIAMSGFSSVAIGTASRPKTTLLLFDHRHLYSILNGLNRMDDLVRAAKQHASRTGESMIPIGPCDI